MSDTTHVEQLDLIKNSLERRTAELGLSEVSGGADAWAAFFLQYNRILTRFVVTAGCPAGSVDDVVCTVWLDVLRYLPTYDHGKSGGFRRWLYRWVFKRVVDEVRRRAPRARACPGDQTTNFWNNLIDPNSPSSADIWERLYRQELAKAVWEEYVRQASIMESEVIRLCVLESSDHGQVANSLNITLDNVRQLKRRGRVRLKVIAAELFGTDSTTNR